MIFAVFDHLSFITSERQYMRIMTINLNLPVGTAVAAHTVLVAADLDLHTSVVPTCFTTVYNNCMPTTLLLNTRGQWSIAVLTTRGPSSG